MPALKTQEGQRSRLQDFSDGIVGNVSDMGLPTRMFRRQTFIRHLRNANNVVFQPRRAMQVRGGSRAALAAQLANEPTTLFKYLNSVEQVGWLVVHCKTGSGTGVLVMASASTGMVPTLQTLTGFSVTDSWCSFAQLNDTLVGTQQGGTAGPFIFTEANGQKSWYPLLLPAPATAPTATGGVGPDAGQTGVDYGLHYYRVRWFYQNGSSKAGPALLFNQNYSPSAVNSPAKVTVTVIVSPDDPTPRNDYITWTLERTKAVSVAPADLTKLVWYFVASGVTNRPGAGTTYIDQRADADLFNVADDAIFGSPSHYEGVIAHQQRIFGWSGDSVYVGEPVGGRGSVSQSTGICNSDPTLKYPIGDDGLPIQSVKKQGDRLIVNKSGRSFAFEGDDPTTGFRIIEIGKGAGAAGSRALAVVGLTGMSFNDSGLHTYQGVKVAPFGRREIGHYLDAMNPSGRGQTVGIDYLDRYMMLAFPSQLSIYNDQTVAYDLTMRNWTHFTNWRIRDAIVQSGTTDFNSATLLFADPLPQSPTGTSGYSANPSFTTWVDSRTLPAQAYAGKVGSDATQPWTANGVLLGANVTASAAFMESQCISDGAGGLYVAWSETRSGGSTNPQEIYLGHVLSNGTIDSANFGANGIAVTGQATWKVSFQLVRDNAGGAILVWVSQDSGPKYAVYAQRVSGAGTLQWNSGSPVVVNNTDNPGAQFNVPSVIPDDAGGCLMCWIGGAGTGAAYAAHLNASGAFAWATVNMDASAAKQNAWLTTDNGGGAICSWRGSDNNIYVQRVDASGTKRWNAGSRLLLSSAKVSIGAGPAVVPDGLGGAVVLWGESSAVQVRGQRVSSAGAIQWTAGGLVLMTPAGATSWPGTNPLQAASDGLGGAVFAACVTIGSAQTLVQRVDVNGVLLWPSIGSPAPTNVYGQSGAQNLGNIVSDAANGAIVSWSDSRSVNPLDIYVQHFNNNGVPQFTPTGLLVCGAASFQQLPFTAFYNTPAGYFPPALTPGYMVWQGFTGVLDYVNFDGTGGVPIPAYLQTPFIDDGMPDEFKNYTRLQPFTDGDPVTITATITLDPGHIVTPVDFAAQVTGASVWAAENNLAAAPGELIWASDDGLVGGNWAVEEPSSPFSGVDYKAIGRRYSIEFSMNVQGPLQFNGYALDYTVLPGRQTSG